jgi:diguanylate cyclase (GGDEF)-like protein
MSEKNGVESLGAGYYWVGSRTLADNLQCNPYLLVDEGGDVVLYDPGSVLDVEDVLANVRSIVALEKVKYVVLHHQDPDLASAVPILEAQGMRFTVVTQWRTWSLARFYGIQSPIYLVDEHGYKLDLHDGRRLQFIPTPYLHFPGAIATYDKTAKTLLSSDLFGAFSPKWNLYADDNYIEGMKAFHEHYMPSNEILRPIMELFLSLDIKRIFPQHGSIIVEDVDRYIVTLKELECGTFMRPVYRDLAEVGGYRVPAEQVLNRFASLFGDEFRDTIIDSLHLGYDPKTKHITDFGMKGDELWNALSYNIHLIKGSTALTLLDPLVSKLCTEFGIKKPAIYSSMYDAVPVAQNESVGGRSTILEREVERLTKQNMELTRAVGKTEGSIMRDQVTGLYNEAFFKDFIDEQAVIALEQQGVEDNVLVVFGIDEALAQIEYQYGSREVEEILRNVARTISESASSNQAAFRLHGATFVLWLPNILFHKAVDVCERIRFSIEKSGVFIEPITVSAGLVAIAEVKDTIKEPTDIGSALTEVGIKRLRIAKKRGGNTLCTTSELDKEVEGRARLLIVDDDTVNADVLRTFFENADYTVHTALDGEEALKKVSEEGYDLIISELMIPKIDGFMIKESLSQRSGTKDIPFILLSHLKDEKTVTRAYNLGVRYYLRKPYMLPELLGIVQNLALAG